MTRTLLTNVHVIDCSGEEPFHGEVLIEDTRIAAVADTPGEISAEGATTLDGQGRSLMPGLVESHAHLSIDNTDDLAALGRIPPEEHTLLTMHNARLYLDHGITSCISAASAKPRLDVVIRNAIEAGEIPGPRLLAASPWLTVTGGLGDMRTLHMPHVESMALVVDGPESYRQVTRELIREGVDIIKLVVSGDSFVPHAGSETTVMSEAEVAAAAEVVHAHGKRMSAHARSAESVKRCVRHGVKVIYHANYADEEALDLLEEHKDHVFISPNIGFTVVAAYEGSAWFTEEQVQAMGFREELASAVQAVGELKKRGVRILGGGDYGFGLTPHGTNARDLDHFVRYLDYTPLEALLTMTRDGGQAMDRPDDLGQVRPGFLADLLLVDGNPLEDLTLLTNPDKLVMIMKDGQFHKRPAL
ncbi:MAG: amidohydrolase family protein [Planctomycetota bacterium]|nr:amidohydrolase family protein [Planctomycetota bacterium]